MNPPFTQVPLDAMQDPSLPHVSCQAFGIFKPSQQLFIHTAKDLDASLRTSIVGNLSQENNMKFCRALKENSSKSVLFAQQWED